MNSETSANNSSSREKPSTKSSGEKRTTADLDEVLHEKGTKVARVEGTSDEVPKPNPRKYSQWTIDHITKLFPECTHNPPYTSDELQKLIPSLGDISKSENLTRLVAYTSQASLERSKYLTAIVEALFETAIPVDVSDNLKASPLYDQILAIMDTVDKVKYLEASGWKLKSHLVEPPIELKSLNELKLAEGFQYVLLKDSEQMINQFVKECEGCSKSWRAREIYAPYFALIQSSGTGKSRLMLESGRFVYVIYICWRPAASSGYPPRSAIVDHFMEFKSADRLEIEFNKFHVACLDLLLDKLILGWSPEKWLEFQNVHHGGILFAEAVKSKMDSIGNDQKAWASIFKRFDKEKDSWSPLFCKNLESMFDGLKASMDTEFKVDAVKSTEDTNFSMGPMDTDVQVNTEGTNSNSGNPIKDTKKPTKESKYDILLELISRFRENKVPLVVFEHDEGSNLLKDVEKVSMFKILRRSLKAFPFDYANLLQYCSVITDTNSNISNFSPALRFDPSRRISGDETLSDLASPFWAFLGWLTIDITTAKSLLSSVIFCDKHPEPLTKEMAKKVSDSELEFQRVIFGLGRPLWHLLNDKSLPLSRSVEFAMKKMCGGSDYYYSESVFDDASCIAYLDCIAMASLTPVSCFTSEIIASKMGLCVGIDDNREIVRSMYESEPILVEACYSIIADCLGGRSQAQKVLDSVPGYLRSGLISTGERGELLMRLSVSFSWLSACKNVAIYGKHYKGPFFSKPIKFEVFLKHLISEYSKSAPFVAEQVGEGNISDTDYEQLMNGIVFATHWVRLKDIRSLDYDTLCQLFVRGCAILAPENFPGIDGFLIVYLPDIDKFTFCLIQSRNKSDSDGEIKWARNAMNPKHIDIVKDDFNLPYMILYQEWRDLRGFSPAKKCVTNLRTFTTAVSEKHDLKSLKVEDKYPSTPVGKTQTTVLLDPTANQKQLGIGLIGCKNRTYAFFDESNLGLRPETFENIRVASKDPAEAINHSILSKDAKEYRIQSLKTMSKLFETPRIAQSK